ncbi:hypothetical protein HUJ04_001955 [Dendroctonus ponderosae]|uniref:ALMS motif domain-containing protein n=1 Tax=Dendroctonus ponderosae TaxID=77166 RepID=A0AAR5QF31_DENPD|nr:hypothetical protein HUJ04_001955 [Dendroctonus ponderosae]
MSSDDNDKSTEQVLDYYKKYSQNRNLPKYFSGSSIAYLPPIVAYDEAPATTFLPTIHPNSAVIISEVKVTVHEEEIIDQEASSSSSSSHSRKLEWDNGADIGYSSVMKSRLKLQKSSSLPILDKTEPNTKVPSTIITHSTSDEKIGLLLFSSSSSKEESSKNSARQSSRTDSEPTSRKTFHATSTETPSSSSKASKCSEADSDVAKFGEFQKTLDFLKQKIGLPGAHSTPYLEAMSAERRRTVTEQMVAESSATPVSQRNAAHEKAGEGLQMENQTSSPKRPQQLNPPVVLRRKQPKDRIHRNVKAKIVELSISTPINVNCKTSDVKTVLPKAVQTEHITQQHIETQFNCENDQEPPLPIDQPEAVSEELSGSASSFEYINLNKNSTQKKSSIENTQTRIERRTSSVSGVLKQISLSKTSTESSSLSKTSSEDIDLHLRILQKLLRSKKLQSSTKRKYIHKLLNEFNQLETSNESNSSSDLFIPKKNLERSRVAFKEGGDTGCSNNLGETDRLEQDKNLAVAEKRMPSEEMSAQPSARSLLAYRTGQVEGDNCDCKPPYVSTDLTQPKSHPLKDIYGNPYKPKIYNFGSIQFKTPELNPDDFPPSSCSCHKENVEEKRRILPDKSSESTSSSTARSTVSFSKKSSEDYLLKFAENERSYQLHWINNEISHLSKLKNILELKSVKPAHSKVSTYHVAQRVSGKSSSRDYVIQTREDFPLDQNINYMLEGKEYVVSDPQKSSNHGANCVLADIIVNSNENGTNIKVRTLCSICKQVVCSCPPKTETLQFKRSSALSACDGSRCSACQKAVCVCKPNSITSKASKEDPSSSEKEIKEPIDLQYSDVELVTAADFNSLQKVFEKCCCTFRSPNCGCDFVKKLLDKFQVKDPNLEKTSQVSQPESLGRNPAASQTERHSQESKAQTSPAPKEDSEAQAGSNSRKNLLCRCTQTDQADPVESTQTGQRQEVKEQCLSTGSIKLLKDRTVQSCLCEATASTQTVSRQNVRDKFSSTSDMAGLTDAESQALRSEDHAKTQTNKKLLRNNAVQVSDDIDQASTQMDREAASQAVQTEIVFGSVSNQEQKSSGSPELQELATEPKVVSNSMDVAIQFPSLSQVNPNTGLSVNSQSSTTVHDGTSSTSTSSGSSRIICFCCKQKAFLAEVSYLQEGNDALAVCSRCYYNRPRYCAHNPRFMCRCWSHYQARQQLNTGRYCTCCRMEVSKCPRKGVMYTVTLEGDSAERRQFAKGDVKDLKIQDGWTRKSLKNKENYCKKEDDLKHSRRERPKKVRRPDGDKKPHKRALNEEVNKDSDGPYTLTEYLIKNRPEFICSAEYRRQVLLNSRILREQQKDDVKLHVLQNNKKATDQRNFQLFTEREMKDINKKNFKKLPEVREKLINQRETRLRSADRLISNIFAKKVQKSVLRGIGNFPIDKPLNNM